MERIPLEDWEAHAGHCARYRWAAGLVRPLEVVNDIACGIGYGAVFLAHVPAEYHGYDRPGVPAEDHFSGRFHGADLDDDLWRPGPADVTVCFETLEHVQRPERLAEVIVSRTRRMVCVSVPVVPTRHLNGHHLHDFTREDIPPMFPGFTITDEWSQPEEFSHVWAFERAAS